MINSNATQRSDEPLASERIDVDRKVFFLDLRENQRGRFLKITEDVNGRRDTIILPAAAFQEFAAAFARITEERSTGI
jgi:PurA-like ssDNA and RNA-binding protein